VAVKGNGHNGFRLHENTTNPRGSGRSANGHLLYVRCPFILQSDNGRDFTNKIIQNLADMWPGMKLVHGKPRHFQSQRSVESSNQDVRDMLVACLSDDNTKTWYEGLSKTRNTELCIQASRQALMRLCLERHRESGLGILLSLKTCTVQQKRKNWNSCLMQE